MSATSEEAVALLRSIDASLKRLVTLLQPQQPQHIASDRDLDSPHGDPVIKAKSPRDWHGPSMEGKRFSECDPVYLDLLAARYDYFAQENETRNELATDGKPKAIYNKRDGARARGWAARIRAGWTPSQDVEASQTWQSKSPDFDDIPF